MIVGRDSIKKKKKSMTSNAFVYKKMHVSPEDKCSKQNPWKPQMQDSKTLQQQSEAAERVWRKRTKHMSFVTHRCQHDQIWVKSLGGYSSEHWFNCSTDKVLSNLIFKFSVGYIRIWFCGTIAAQEVSSVAASCNLCVLRQDPEPNWHKPIHS